MLIVKPVAKIQVLSFMKDKNDRILSIMDDKILFASLLGRILVSQKFYGKELAQYYAFRTTNS